MRAFFVEILVGPVVRPCTRVVVGFLAIPMFRALRRRVADPQAWDREFEKDVEQWFRASLLLLAATKNFENWLGTALELHFQHDFSQKEWWITAGRVLLAMGVAYLLMRRMGRKTLKITLNDPVDAVPAGLEEWNLRLEDDGHQLCYAFDSNAERTGIASLMKQLGDLHIGYKDLSTRQSSLEDIFVELVHAPGKAA